MNQGAVADYRRGSNEGNTFQKAQGLKLLLRKVLRYLAKSKVLP